MAIEITSPASFADFVKSRDRVVARFTAEWCGPCRALKPHIARLENEYQLVSFADIDIDKTQEIALAFKVTSVPTFVYFFEGKEVARVSGADIGNITKELKSLNSRTPKPATPKNFPKFSGEIINSSVDLSASELLNVDAPDSSEQLRDLLGPGEKVTKTDADSQLIAFLPLMNKTSLSSIHIKVDKGEEQPPSKIKLWNSLASALSFEDADSLKAVVDTTLETPDKDGWIEVKLRQVLFQNISSILIFLCGEDDDEPIALKQIVLVGKSKDRNQPGRLFDDEE